MGQKNDTYGFSLGFTLLIGLSEVVLAPLGLGAASYPFIKPCVTGLENSIFGLSQTYEGLNEF